MSQAAVCQQPYKLGTAIAAVLLACDSPCNSKCWCSS